MPVSSSATTTPRPLNPGREIPGVAAAPRAGPRGDGTWTTTISRPPSCGTGRSPSSPCQPAGEEGEPDGSALRAGPLPETAKAIAATAATTTTERPVLAVRRIDVEV